MTGGGGASEFSAAVLAEFVKLGVRHVVVSPGSRSQALALAASEFERAGLLTLSVRIDERSAGFLALGIGVESGVPAIIITTSGTAVANLMPAVLEAHHSGVPMIVFTADRPEELRGIGSNQTTHQLGMFGDFVRLAREVEAPSAAPGDERNDEPSDANGDERGDANDAGGFDRAFPGQLAREVVSAAEGHSGNAGPVHVNMAFREPLSGEFDHSVLEALPVVDHGSSVGVAIATRIPFLPDTVVIAGHDSGPIAEETARLLGAPLLAEVSSGAHFGRNLVVAYRELLGMPEFGGRVRRVIVFGHPTLSREVPQLIQTEGVETIVVRGAAPEDFNPGHRVAQFVDAIEVSGGTEAADPAWLGSWVHASRDLLAERTGTEPASARTDDNQAIREFMKAQLAVFRAPVTRRMLVEAVWHKTWPHDRLVFGSSRLIREADRVVSGKNIRVHANRGLAGIDGTIATATGIALASQAANASGNAAAGTTRVLLGDLAFLHDVGSLLAAPSEVVPRIQVIVGNDGGGTIFDSLEVSGTAAKEAFDRVMYTPQTVVLADLASAYGWNYVRAENRGQLDEALGNPHERTIIEVPLPR